MTTDASDLLRTMIDACNRLPANPIMRVREIRLHPFDYLRLPVVPKAPAKPSWVETTPTFPDVIVKSDRFVPVGMQACYDGNGTFLGQVPLVRSR